MIQGEKREGEGERERERERQREVSFLEIENLSLITRKRSGTAKVFFSKMWSPLVKDIFRLPSMQR